MFFLQYGSWVFHRWLSYFIHCSDHGSTKRPLLEHTLLCNDNNKNLEASTTVKWSKITLSTCSLRKQWESLLHAFENAQLYYKVFSLLSLCVCCPDAPCSELQGMLSGLLPDSQISASSMRDIHGSMGAARLVASRSGWFPNPTQPIAGEEWLQVRHYMIELVFYRMAGVE